MTTSPLSPVRALAKDLVEAIGAAREEAPRHHALQAIEGCAEGLAHNLYRLEQGDGDAALALAGWCAGRLNGLCYPLTPNTRRPDIERIADRCLDLTGLILARLIHPREA